MTEQDALQKWCPFAWIAVDAGSGGASANRSGNSTCIASQCMAWQPDHPMLVPAGNGCCGLVGRGPEYAP